MIGPLDNQFTLGHPVLVDVATRAQSSNDVCSRVERDVAVLEVDWHFAAVEDEGWVVLE